MQKIKCNNCNTKRVVDDVRIGLGDMMARVIGLKLWETATPAELAEYQKLYDALRKANDKAHKIISRLEF